MQKEHKHEARENRVRFFYAYLQPATCNLKPNCCKKIAWDNYLPPITTAVYNILLIEL